MDKIIINKIVSPTKEILDITTKWMYEWWGVEDKYKYDDVYTYMKNSFNKERLPQTFIMCLGDKIIGMYQITYRDLFIILYFSFICFNNIFHIIKYSIFITFASKHFI